MKPAPLPRYIAVDGVHVLHHGHPICDRVSGMPNRWPRGHVWVPLIQKDKATCPGCIRELAPKVVRR